MIYDVGITGGGLAGLTAAIQLRKKGYTVILFEKNKYPFHRVCGEYIAMESWAHLIDCGVDLPDLHLPRISKLKVSAPNGNLLSAPLDTGGFGISRFMLDNLLYQAAKKTGVAILENSKVTDIKFKGQFYEIQSGTNSYKVTVALGGFGKRSNIDVKWNRNFIIQKPNPLNNYIGVKYHIKTDFAEDTIALHNFKNGYCGISKIEEDKYCLCYLTTAANLQIHGSIGAMETNILYRNKYLKEIFERSHFLFDKPVSISQISFANKEIVYNNIPLMGDAGGMITPLCGNGMSMALHSAKLLCAAVAAYLQNKISLMEMLNSYQQNWEYHFAKRLRTGRLLQSNFGKELQTNLFVSVMKSMPWLTKQIISATHGRKF